jgi:hypothetical protein
LYFLVTNPQAWYFDDGKLRVRPGIITQALLFKFKPLRVGTIMIPWAGILSLVARKISSNEK